MVSAQQPGSISTNAVSLSLSNVLTHLLQFFHKNTHCIPHTGAANPAGATRGSIEMTARNIPGTSEFGIGTGLIQNIMQDVNRHSSIQQRNVSMTPHSMVSNPNTHRVLPQHTQLQAHEGFREKIRGVLNNALSNKEFVVILYSNHLFANMLTSPRPCISCLRKTPTTRLVVAPCQHHYCSDCLCRMGKMALKDLDSFPVRCCGQEISVKKVVSNMQGPERDTYRKRSEEYALPPPERWYCPFPNCGQWIHPRNLTTRSNPLKCPHCDVAICVDCRDLAHQGRNCAKDPGLAAILSLARDKNWQRCFNCGFVVEKLDGCTHIVCKCRAEFWYVTSNSPNFVEKILISSSYGCGHSLNSCTCETNPRYIIRRDPPHLTPEQDAMILAAVREEVRARQETQARVTTREVNEDGNS